MQAAISDDRGLDIPFMRMTGLLPSAEQAHARLPSSHGSLPIMAGQDADIGDGTAHFSAEPAIYPPALFEDGEVATPRTSSHISSPSPTSRAQDLQEDELPYQAPWCSKVLGSGF